MHPPTDPVVWPDVYVFHAGTKATPDGKVVTNGGRVLAVTATAPTLKEAQALAYKGVDCVHFEGKTFRRDIAYKCVSQQARDIGSVLIRLHRLTGRSSRRNGRSRRA